MVPFDLFLRGPFLALLCIALAATISTPAFALPDQVFWKHDDWPSDLEAVGSGAPLLEGTVLFAQSQIIPSKHRLPNDDQPHLTALKKTLVMLRPHYINDQSTNMELTVGDADGNIVSDPILMEIPENIPKQEGWIDIESIFPDNGGSDSTLGRFPTELNNPHVITGQSSLDSIGDYPTAVGLITLLNDHEEVEIKTADGSWMNDFYLPNGSDIPSNSKIQFTCNSQWGINVYYHNPQTGIRTLTIMCRKSVWEYF